MKITKTSPFSGKTRTRDINVSADQMKEWKKGKLIQHAMPHLSADDREFLKTGITSDEWPKESYIARPFTRDISKLDTVAKTIYDMMVQKGQIDEKSGREELEDMMDDGWYTHSEIHGKKGISKEDWKKGWRLNGKGERVQTKNEETVTETKVREKIYVLPPNWSNKEDHGKMARDQEREEEDAENYKQETGRYPKRKSIKFQDAAATGKPRHFAKEETIAEDKFRSYGLSVVTRHPKHDLSSEAEDHMSAKKIPFEAISAGAGSAEYSFKEKKHRDQVHKHLSSFGKNVSNKFDYDKNGIIEDIQHDDDYTHIVWFRKGNVVGARDHKGVYVKANDENHAETIAMGRYKDHKKEGYVVDHVKTMKEETVAEGKLSDQALKDKGELTSAKFRKKWHAGKDKVEPKNEEIVNEVKKEAKKDKADWRKPLKKDKYGTPFYFHTYDNKDEKKKKKNEETIDELNKSTLSSYIKKAHVSGLGAAAAGETAYQKLQRTTTDKPAIKARLAIQKSNKTGQKREDGINRAANKLAREESIDEAGIGEQPSVIPPKKSNLQSKAHALIKKQKADGKI